jgi:oleate hydratase
MEQFTGNKAGTGGLVTLVDSSWLLSVVLPYQPHFVNQPEDINVFWGYGLFPDEEATTSRRRCRIAPAKNFSKNLAISSASRITSH